MTNVFDDDGGEFLVLINGANQHSLWPAAIEVPGGWTSVHGPLSRQSCLDYVDRNWVDMRPAGPVGATPVEQLCQIFAEVLQRDRVGADDDFFVLGGHSLVATRLTNVIADRLGVRPSLQTLFENPTPAALGEQLGRATRRRPALRPQVSPAGDP